MDDIQEIFPAILSVSFNYIVLKYNEVSNRRDVVGVMNAEHRCYLDLSGEVRELTPDMNLIMRSSEKRITADTYTVLEWAHNHDYGTFDVTRYSEGKPSSTTKYIVRLTPEQYVKVEYKLGKHADDLLRILGFSNLINRKSLEYKKTLEKPTEGDIIRKQVLNALNKKTDEDSETVTYIDFSRLVYSEHGILLGLTNKKATHYVSLWDGILPIESNYTLTSYKIHHSKYRLKFGFTKWPNFEIEEHERLQLSPNYTYQRNITSIYEVHVSKEDIVKYAKELHFPSGNKTREYFH